MTRHKPRPGIRSRFSRRDWLRLTSMGIASGSAVPWLPALAEQAGGDPGRKRSCILLWMSGGPSQIDTFDPKPEHANGGPLQPLETSVPGIWIGEHLPRLTRELNDMAILRSMTSNEGDHARATMHLKTGYPPVGPIEYPTLGSLLSKELGHDDAAIPNYVSVAPARSLAPKAWQPGYLGPRYAALEVGSASNRENASLAVANLSPLSGVTDEQQDARRRLWTASVSEFQKGRSGAFTQSHAESYRAAERLMQSTARRAFELEREPLALRDSYGRHPFGQGCLLARRLVQRGVPFVEVSLNGVQGNTAFGWDTHNDNFASIQRLCQVLDAGWSALLSDLRQRGLLASTLVVWMGEFGRTPHINRNNGRDHFPQAWSAVLAGGGIRGGQVIGSTTADGMQVRDRPIKVSDLIATICRALGVDPLAQNVSNVGRPIRLADPDAVPVEEVLL